MISHNPTIPMFSLLRSRNLFLFAASLILGLSASQLSANTIIWSGANHATDTNWSDAANWVGGVAPGNADDVKFFNLGTASAIGVTNSIVDNSFAGTIGSLQYGATNGFGFHTTFIPSGDTLWATNTNGVYVGTSADLGVAYTNYATIAGGGTLIVSNSSANISLNQGTATSANFCQSILNLTNLSTFNATVNRIALGTTTAINPGGANQREAGSLYLAATNNITVLYSAPLNSYQTVGSTTNGIELQKNPGNNGGSTTPTTLFLGISNVINVDSIGVGRDKSDASCLGRMMFNPSFIGNNPSAYFYGVSGPGSRVTWWAIGDGGANASSSHGGYGTNDFSGGTINAFVNVMSLGRDASPSSTWGGPNKGSLTFTAGTIDVNTVYVGNQTLGPGSSTTPNVGVINVNGASATLKVNSLMVLGNTTANSTAAANTSGTLQITGGTATLNQVTIGANSTAANIITVTNGSLVVSNTVASPARGLSTFSLSGSSLLLNVVTSGGSPLTNIIATSFSASGSDTINIGSAPLFSSYPVVVKLIKYTGSIGGAGYSALTLGSIPGDLPGAFLSNDTANASVDLVIPINPVPVITSQPLPFGGSPGSTVNLSIVNTGNTPYTYQWYYENNSVTNALTDGPGESGSSTLSGSIASSLTINNAQPGDTGGYFAIVTNIYGAATSSVAQVAISVNPIAPIVNGPFNETVIAGSTATINATASGNPFPVFQWQFAGVNLTDGPGPNGEIYAGTQTTSLNITNVQYPADQGTYSFIATNSAGAVTNSMTLTVIVTPGITNQPTSLVVTNTQAASFTVLAGGVPAPTYQWYFNGNPISLAANGSAQSATLSFAHASPTNIGTYYVQVSNAAGSVNSASVTLTVNSTMGYSSLSPANAATGVCYDTPLYITFTQTPTLLTVGKIRIYNVTNATTPVDIIDLTQSVTNDPGVEVDVQAYTIGGQVLTNFPVILNGNTAAIYPHHDLLTSNQTYYVTMDAGTFADSTGAYFAGISATNAWQFTTKVGGPANSTNIVVAQNGSGDFLTVQGAVDFVSSNNVTPTIINIRNGTYEELVNVNTKNNLDFRGQSRNGVFLGYPNNNNLYAGAPQRSSFILNGNDCSFETLTITNMTPAGGSQAEAMDVEGTRAIFLNLELDSFQDTFLVHSAGKLVYFQDSLITGQTDFNWGYGSVYYTNCEIRCVLSGGHVTQPRSPATTNGFGFINCRITKGYTGTNTFDLGRTIGTPSSPSEVLFATCLIDTNCTGYSSDAGPNMSDYSCTNLETLTPANLTFSTHLGPTDPTVVAIQSPFTWLGWAPALAPNIVGQPTNQTVGAGQSATFTAAGTGVPNPNYQWLFNGQPIAGATSATYNIASAQGTNAGSYSVVVSNGSGSVTSQVATLTYILPVANTATYTQYAGEPLGINVTNLLTHVTDASPNAVLSVAGTGVSTNGVTLGSAPGFLLYQNPNNVPDQFTYYVTDGYLGTNSGLVNVVINTNSVFGTAGPILTATNNGGPTTITYAGIAGLSYSVNRTTNLLGGWTTVWTTNMPAGGTFQFTDNNPPQPYAYYILVWNWY
jgi:pectin methylesterase-like acyl-CoA thioesterase